MQLVREQTALFWLSSHFKLAALFPSQVNVLSCLNESARNINSSPLCLNDTKPSVKQTDEAGNVKYCLKRARQLLSP